MSAFNDNFGKEMKELARRYKFFVMEDSKLADVDSITFRQMMGGVFKIDEWASFVTIHGLTYDSVIDYYKRQYNSSYPLNLSPCIVAQMNAENNLLNEDIKSIHDETNSDINRTLINQASSNSEAQFNIYDHNKNNMSNKINKEILKNPIIDYFISSLPNLSPNHNPLETHQTEIFMKLLHQEINCITNNIRDFLKFNIEKKKNSEK